MAKPWWQSKTIWVNAATLAVSVLGTIAGSELIAAHPEVVAVLASVVAAINVVLRFVTTVPVKS